MTVAFSPLEGMALQAETSRLLGLLERRGLRAVALKGPGLAERAHGDIGLRSAGDVDVLVARGDLDAAVAVLRGDGYAPSGDRSHDLHRTLSAPGRPEAELHWRVHWHEQRFSGDVLGRCGPGPDGRLVARVEDEAAMLLLFHARDGFLGLRLPADIAGWWDRQVDGGRRGLLDEHAVRYPELARTWRAAALAAEPVTGISAARWLTPCPRTGTRIRLAVRLASWSGRGDYDQHVADVALVDGLLAPAGALPCYVRRQLRGAPGNVLLHAAKVLARFTVALWRVRRRPGDPLPPSARLSGR